MRIAFLLVLLSLSSNAWGCMMTPPEQTTDPDELISRTKNIVLAKVVRADAGSSRWHVLYTLKTERTYKGNPPRAFQLLGGRLLGPSSIERFDEHRDPAFWTKYGGREFHDTSCAIRPTFIVGATYLIFLDAPYHNKSFEEIYFTGDDRSEKDRWLHYVESRIADGKR